MNLKAEQTDNFADKLETYPKKLQDIIIGKIKKLESNPGYSSLRTKKIKGQTDIFESSINKSIRILWHYDGSKIILLDVGYHDILKKY